MNYSPLDLAAAFIQAGELADALAALNAHLDAHPDDDRARRMRIAVARHLNQPEPVQLALGDFARLSNPTPQDAIQQSILLEQAGDSDGVQTVLAEAHVRWPEDDRLTERYLGWLLAQGQGTAALAVVRRLPMRWRWLQWEGDALVALGDDLLATARYGLALAQLEDQIAPGNADYFGPIKARLLLARAGAYHRLNLLDQANEHYTAAGQLIPDDPAIPFNRGLLEWLRGDQAHALLICRAALAGASESLRAHLLDDLRADPRYADLLKALET